MNKSFTPEEFLAWAKTKPSDETYNYISNGNCAVAQFLKETERAERPYVYPFGYNINDATYSIPKVIEKSLRNPHSYGFRTSKSFGRLVEDLEKNLELA